MKKTTFLIILSFFILSCKKDNSNHSLNIQTITYEEDSIHTLLPVPIGIENFDNESCTKTEVDTHRVLKLINSHLEISELFPEIKNTETKFIIQGCIGRDITLGEFYLNSIIDYHHIKRNKDLKIRISINILKDFSLYHLHDYAASQILIELGFLRNENARDLIHRNTFKTPENTDDFSEVLKLIKNDKLNYILLKLIFPYNNELFPYLDGEFDDLFIEKSEIIFKYINSSKISDDTKIFLVDLLYTISTSHENGIIINNTIANSQLNLPIKQHSSKIYKQYLKNKPKYMLLDSIDTWMEMDKNVKHIEELFTGQSEIMFLQISSFNTSTVLESERLIRLKLNGLNNMMLKKNNSNRFAEYYKLIFLIEFANKSSTTRFFEELPSFSSEKIKQMKLLKTNM